MAYHIKLMKYFINVLTMAASSIIKCKNYELCNETLPDWWFSCKGSYLCTNCDMLFGTWGTKTGKGILNFTDNLECPVCLETKRSIDQPNCEHTLCIKCFKRCYYGEELQEPPFPYPEVEDEYYDSPDDPKWKEYPLIETHNIICEEMELKKWEEQELLGKCPLCRK